MATQGYKSIIEPFTIQTQWILPVGLGLVSIVWSNFMLLMSYKKICSSNTTISLRRFILTAKMVVGNVSSQIVDCLWYIKYVSDENRWVSHIGCTLVLMIWSCLELKPSWSATPTSATREVQNSISTILAPRPAIEIKVSIHLYRHWTCIKYICYSIVQKGRSCTFDSLFRYRQRHS